MAEKEPDWDWIKTTSFSTARPPGWPENVAALTWNGHALFGMDRKTGEIYWDGQRLITEKRFSDFERRLAVIGLIIGGIGVAATVVQAWAVLQSPTAQMTDLQYCVEHLEAEEPTNTAFDALTYCNSVL
jgi:hypothetical protein